MIESVNNEKVKFFKKLREKKYILENKMYIVEGEHLVEEAFKAGILLEVILCEDTLNNYGVKETRTSKRVMESISLLKSVPNIMGVVKLIESNEIKGKRIVILDDVQDPGNAGTIIRSALAFNVDTVIFSTNSVNIYNDKLVRSSEGTIFNMNTVVMDLSDAIHKVKEKGIKVYYADMDGNINIDDLEVQDYALVLGSEGKGISEITKREADYSIKVEMNSKCESLNVSICGGIIMHKLR